MLLWAMHVDTVKVATSLLMVSYDCHSVYDQEYYYVFNLHSGIALTSNRNIGTVGSTITFRCSSDLHPIRIEWYRNGSLLSQTTAQSGSVTLESDLISTDDEGAVYICKAIGHRGSQERDKTLHVQGSYNAL